VNTARLSIVLGIGIALSGCGRSTPPPPAPPTPTADAVVSADTNSAPADTNVGAIGQDRLPTPAPAPQTNGTVVQVLNAPNTYLEGLANGQRRAIKTIDIAQLNQAIQMFNAEEDHYPKDLNELVRRGLIAKIPDPPYQMKIAYDPNTGEVSVVPIDQ
jgi:hypothetical protein